MVRDDRHLTAHAAVPEGPGARALPLDGTEFRELVLEALELAGAVWIRATGSSNEPTIPANATVRVQRRTGPVRVGDMVLVLSRERRPLLHRVRWITGTRIVTIGDARLENDPVATLADIAGTVDVVAVNGQTLPVSRGYLTALRLELLRLKRRIAIALWRLIHRAGSGS